MTEGKKRRNARYRAKYPEKMRAYYAAWRAAHPGYFTKEARAARRREAAKTESEHICSKLAEWRAKRKK